MRFFPNSKSVHCGLANRIYRNILEEIRLFNNQTVIRFKFNFKLQIRIIVTQYFGFLLLHEIINLFRNFSAKKNQV